ncbi:MAG: hypothetical protein JOZ17_00455 [Acetobacteraceae bacterium]|nr:hypothetical protein [Acetobacteraceae bacterium]MBV8616197.1 hypothetical protein [Acetobacteraceae bacterium]
MSSHGWVVLGIAHHNQIRPTFSSSAGTVVRFLAHCGVPQGDANPPRSAHQPVRGALNDELVRLFRAQEAEFVQIMDSFRPPLI